MYSERWGGRPCSAPVDSLLPQTVAAGRILERHHSHGAAVLRGIPQDDLERMGMESVFGDTLHHLAQMSDSMHPELDKAA